MKKEPDSNPPIIDVSHIIAVGADGGSDADCELTLMGLDSLGLAGRDPDMNKMGLSHAYSNFILHTAGGGGQDYGTLHHVDTGAVNNSNLSSRRVVESKTDRFPIDEPFAGMPNGREKQALTK